MSILNCLPFRKKIDFEQYKSVKICLPFTTDLLDKSVYDNSLVNFGNVQLDDNGAVFIKGNQLRIREYDNFSFLHKGIVDYTIEFIVSISNKLTTEYQHILTTNGATDANAGVFIRKIVNSRDIDFYVCSGTGQYSGYIVKGVIMTMPNDELPHHYAVVYDNERDAYTGYVDGVKENTLTRTGAYATKNNSDFYISGANSSVEGVLVGTLGGLKITNKALDPSQFSMMRPFEPFVKPVNITARVALCRERERES